jgi:hypothetical protein
VAYPPRQSIPSAHQQPHAHVGDVHPGHRGGPRREQLFRLPAHDQLAAAIDRRPDLEPVTRARVSPSELRRTRPIQAVVRPGCRLAWHSHDLRVVHDPGLTGHFFFQSLRLVRGTQGDDRGDAALSRRRSAAVPPDHGPMIDSSISIAWCKDPNSRPALFSNCFAAAPGHAILCVASISPVSLRRPCSPPCSRAPGQSRGDAIASA